jgi:hypothetical protein
MGGIRCPNGHSVNLSFSPTTNEGWFVTQADVESLHVRLHWETAHDMLEWLKGRKSLFHCKECGIHFPENAAPTSSGYIQDDLQEAEAIREAYEADDCELCPHGIGYDDDCEDCDEVEA